MSYIVKHSGRATFKTIEVMCPACRYNEERQVDQRDKTDEEVEQALHRELTCPNCGEAEMERVYLTAPSVGQYMNENSPKTFEARKKFFKQRFMKKEADDIREQHGVNFDDSLRSGAAQKIKRDMDQ